MRKIYLDTKTIIYFATLLIFTIASSFINSFTYSSFFGNLFSSFSDSLSIIFVFCFIFFTTNKILNIFKENEFILLRYPKKIDYYKLCISNSLKSSALYYLIYILVNVIFVFLVSKNIGMTIYPFYNISSSLYLLFYLIRKFIIIYLISLISVFIIQFFNNKIKYIVPLIFASILFLSPTFYDFKIDSILKFQFNFASYFNYYEYSNFIFEIFMSSLYVMLLVGFLILVINILLNNCHVVNIKYVFMKYFSLFKKYILKFLVVYIFIAFLDFYLYYDPVLESELYNQMFLYSFKGVDILIIIFKIFGIIFFIFCSYILHKKIISESYEYLYLRVNKRKLFLINIILSTFVLFIMRLIIYIFVGLLFYMESNIFMFNYSYMLYDFTLIIIMNIVVSFMVKFKNHI